MGNHIRLFPDDFDQHPFPSSPVEFTVEYLFPGAEVEFALGDGNNNLAPHDLAFQMRIGIVLTRAVVVVLRGWFMRGELFQPHIVVMQQTILRIIYEDRRGYMHGIHQTDALFDSAFLHQSLDGTGNVNEPPAIRDFKPKIFRERFHMDWMPTKWKK